MFMDRGDNSFEGGADFDMVDFLHSIRVVQGGILGGGSLRDGAVAVGFSVDLESGETRASTLDGDAFTDFFGTNTFESVETYNLTDRNDILRGDDTSDLHSGVRRRRHHRRPRRRRPINGGAGINTASYESSPQAVDVDLSRRYGVQVGGDAAGDTLLPCRISSARPATICLSATAMPIASKVEGRRQHHWRRRPRRVAWWRRLRSLHLQVHLGLGRDFQPA